MGERGDFRRLLCRGVAVLTLQFALETYAGGKTAEIVTHVGFNGATAGTNLYCKTSSP